MMHDHGSCFVLLDQHSRKGYAMSDFTWSGAQQDQFFDAYISCALWSSLDDDDKPLDDSYDESDLSDDARQNMREECDDFMNAQMTDLYKLDPGQCGHDFWLSRNRHGTGFWDRGTGDVGDRLHAAAKVYGSSDLYVGDDEKLHVS